jgi:hypothetical protein
MAASRAAPFLDVVEQGQVAGGRAHEAAVDEAAQQLVPLAAVGHPVGRCHLLEAPVRGALPAEQLSPSHDVVRRLQLVGGDVDRSDVHERRG